jgi:mRNA interferase MazF
MLVDMAGLPAASIVRTAKIATIEAADAQRIGAPPGADRVAVRAQVAGTPATPLGR